MDTLILFTGATIRIRSMVYWLNLRTSEQKVAGSNLTTALKFYGSDFFFFFLIKI